MIDLGKGDHPEDKNGQGEARDDSPENAAVDGHMTDPGGGSRTLEIEMAWLEIMQEVRR